MMDQWLVRTSENWIAGPYPKEQICQMILEGKLGLQDEVCSGNGYWIYIHERDEVKELLGIDVPKQASETEDEITQTQLGYEDEDITDPDITQVRAKPAETSTDHTAVISTTAIKGLKSRKKETPSLTRKIKKTADAVSTAVPSNGTVHVSEAHTPAASTSATSVSPHSNPVSSPTVHGISSVPRVEVMGQMDKPSFWRGLAWVLVAASGVLVIFLIRLLKS